MGKMVLYSCKRKNGLYLQGMEANKNYVKNATAPTMGARHDYYEYCTVWGKEKKLFEPLTLCGHLRVIMEENRWKPDALYDIEILPEQGDADAL